MSLFKHKEAKVRDPFDFAIKVPEGWCGHSPDPDPAVQQKTTEMAVDQMIRLEPVLAEARGEIIERMFGFAGEANEKQAMVAASLWTVVDGTEAAANMMVFSAARDASQSVEDDVARVERELSTPDPDDVKDREVSVVDLPAGKAVRLRVLTKTPSEDGEAGLVVEVVQYWLPVPDAGHSLIVSCTTPCLVYGDELTAVFDSIAGSLQLT
jgi:hypothetical protein